MKPDLSIIVCTRNRAESLRSTLLSIGQVLVPSGWTVELLVVDNASTDSTRTVVSETKLDNVQLHYVHEPVAGVSHARNRGLRETSGEIILFTDDDVRVPANWIVGMCEPILAGTSDAVAGGIMFPARIAFVMSHPPLSSLRAWFACSEYLNPDRPANMIGANMAFHRRVLASAPEFDTELGAGALGSFEEILFCLRFLDAGFRLTGAFDIVVVHHFDLSRVTASSLIETACKMGRSRAYIFHHWDHKNFRLPYLRLASLGCQLLWTQLADRIWPEKSALPSIKTIRLTERASFCREYIALRKKPYIYARETSANLGNRREGGNTTS